MGTALAGTIFVMWHKPIYLFIILTSISVDYLAARAIYRSSPSAKSRKYYLILSLTVSLALLGVFKYTNFVLETTEHMARAFHIVASLPRVYWLLPMGISFYTFCSMSYTIDVYRNELKPARKFGDFYYFITFFPHLVAGPIIRANQFIYQISRRRRPQLKIFNAGAFLIVKGVFLKMVCADNINVFLAPRWNSEQIASLNPLTLWFYALLFSFQIFCDFEGYSCIARGLAYWLGYRFPINFDNPYLATSFSNFWERWHITLSSWFRDYLYKPLGGNRKSVPRTYQNLLFVMVLAGLWHGAALTFVAWGLLHGVMLVFERLLGLNKMGPERSTALRIFWFLVVQTAVLVGWIFFRSQSLPEAFVFLKHLFKWNLQRPYGVLSIGLFLIPPVIMHVHGWMVDRRLLKPLSHTGRALLVGALIYATLMFYGESSEFIYFQF